MSNSNRIEKLERRVKRLEEDVILLLKWEQERLDEKVKHLKEQQLVRLSTLDYLDSLPTFEELLKNEHFRD